MFSEEHNIVSRIKRRFAHAQSPFTLWNAHQSVGTSEDFKLLFFSVK